MESSDGERDAPSRSDAPPGWHDSSPPSRRRDSLPPLRSLSVVPPRLSALPGRSTPPGRLSALPAKAPEERGLRPLLAVAVAASVMVLAMATLNPIPAATSIQGSHLDALWTTSVGKQ